jgi:hypothetical protein
MQVVGDLKRVKAIFESIRQEEGCEDNEGAYSEMIPEVLKWGTYSEEEKCKVAFKNFSHEFNLFLKLRDPEFFTKVILPLLECKMEKSLEDLYLCDQHKLLVSKYLTLKHLQSLNAFKLCLLIDSLTKLSR